MKMLNFLIAFALYLCCAVSLYAQKDSMNIDIQYEEHYTPLYFIYEKAFQFNDCMRILERPWYNIGVYINPSKETMVLKKSNKWGLWNIKQQKFIFEPQFDSVITIIIEKDTNTYEETIYKNHFFAVLNEKQWYLLDTAFQKIDTMGYDSVEYDFEKISTYLILYKKGKINLYNPFENKTNYIEVDSFYKHRSEIRLGRDICFYYKNGKIGRLHTIDDVYYPAIYSKTISNKNGGFFLLKDSTMDFLHSRHSSIVPNLRQKVWNIQQWEDKFYSFRGVYTYRSFCDDDFHLMFLTKDNKYILFQKKGEVFMLKTVPFITILEPIYLLFLSPYYQKIE